MNDWKRRMARLRELPRGTQQAIADEVDGLIARLAPPPTEEEMLGIVPCPDCKRGRHNECQGMFKSAFDKKPICCLCTTCDPNLLDEARGRRRRTEAEINDQR